MVLAQAKEITNFLNHSVEGMVNHHIAPINFEILLSCRLF